MAGEIELLPVRSLQYEVGHDASGLAGRQRASLPDPEYIAGSWYVADSFTIGSAGGALPGNSARFYLAKVRETVTLNALGVRIITASSGGNVQAAIYANDPTIMRPTGPLLAATASISTTTGGSFNSTISKQLGSGQYWFGINTDNAVATFVCGSTTSLLSASLIGSATQANNLGAGGGALTYVSTPLTFGTWGDLTGATFTEANASNVFGLVQFKVASVP